MMKLLLLSACALLAIACGSSANNGSESNRSNSTIAKTNVNGESSIPYSRTENAYTLAQNSDLALDLTPSGTKEAREIVGKTVTETKLWQNKKFDDRIRKIMGSDYATMRKSWNTETPIKKFGDFLMMTGCEQHNCADNRYVILIDVGGGSINVIHFGKDATREWNANQKIGILPPPFEEELAAMKSGK